MAKASINFATAKGGGESEKHMDRDKDHKVTYLLDNDSKNNEYKTYRSSQDYLDAAKLATKEKTGRSMQKSAEQNFIQEALLNLNENHTIEDVEKVFEDLQKEFGGFEVFKISIHRDEGVFLDTKHDLKDLEYDARSLTWIKEGVDVTNEVIDYAPGRNIFYNKDDKNWYLDKQLTKEADTSKYQTKINYHAHVQFTKFDMSQGKNARLQKKDMSKIQDINAKSLKMERGINYGKEGKAAAKRMNHYQLKQEIDKKRDLKLTVAKVKDINTLKDEIKKEMIAEGGHSKEEYQSLNKLFKDLKADHKEQKLTIDDLNEKINHWKHEAMNWKESKTYKDLYENSKKENEDLKKELQAKISINPTPSPTNTSKNDLKPISDELYQELEPHVKKNENSKDDLIALESTINKTLNTDLNKLIEKNIKEHEIKVGVMGGKVSVDQLVDINGLKKDLNKLQDQHQVNYSRFGKILQAIKKPGEIIGKIVENIKNNIFMEKRQERIQNRSQNKGQGL